MNIMNNLDIARHCSVFIITTLSVMMMPAAFADSKGGKFDSKENKQSSGKVIKTAPATKPTNLDFPYTLNDARTTENPVKSVLDLLGINSEYHGSSTKSDYHPSSHANTQGKTNSSNQSRHHAGNQSYTQTKNSSDNVTPPDVETDDPFAGITDNGDSSSTEIGNPLDAELEYGSVPLIRDDAESVKFLLDKMVSDALEESYSSANASNATSILEATYRPYARKLAKTLSELSQEEQNYVFYGNR
jgi:hypothetical protein